MLHHTPVQGFAQEYDATLKVLMFWQVALVNIARYKPLVQLVWWLQVEVKASGFQSGANCPQYAIFVIYAVLTPSIIAAGLTYTAIQEVEWEVMQECHYAFSDVTSTRFIGTLKIVKYSGTQI